MTNYTKTTDFAAKDSLPSGDSGKIIRGSEFETEFDNIATAVNSKSDANNPTFTGTVTIDGLTVNGNTVLGNAATDTVTVTADIASNLIPSADDTYNLGASGAEWNDLFIDGTANIDSLVAGSGSFTSISTTGDVTFGDNDKAIFGASSDLQIYHDGSNSYISESGTGNLNINANRFVVGSGAPNYEYMMQAIPDGAVQLYHNNLQKLNTTSTGVDVTGTVKSDDALIAVSSGYANLYFNDESSSSARYATIGKNYDSPFDLKLTASNSASSVPIIFNTSSSHTAMQIDSTGIDVTGTVTADGLTVQTAQGDISIDNTYSSLDFARSGTNYFRATDASGNFRFITGGENFTTNRFDILANGDLRAYEDTGTTAKLVWDASTERLQLGDTVQSINNGANGTFNPKLSHIDGGAAQAGIVIGTGGTKNIRVGLFADDTNGVCGISTRFSSGTNPAFVFRDALSGGNERMRIDSNGNVGIGNSAPTTALDVTGTVTADDVKSDLFGAADGSASNPSIRNTGDSNTGFYFPAADTIGVSTGGSEAIRIDSSGNLLVGTTSASLAGAGTKIFSDGTTYHTRNGGTPLWVNRETSDGDLLEFRKDNATVGSIGANVSRFYIHGSYGSGAGLRFDNASIRPATSTGTSSDATTDLGASAARFKDLYLSGGAYLGGTAAANKLDDYEEGTWTPVYEPTTGSFTTMTMVVSHATYTKVGDAVFVTAYIRTNDVDLTGGSGGVQISGLPFSASGSHSVQIGYTTTWTNEPLSGYVSGSIIRLQKRTGIQTNTTSTIPSDLTDGTVANANELVFSAYYVTSA